MVEQPKDLSYLTEFDLSMDKESIKRSFANHVEYTQGKDQYSVTPLDFYKSLAYSVRDRLLDRWNKTQQAYYNEDRKRVYYLSLEFLIGRLLEDGLINLDIHQQAQASLNELGLSLDEIIEVEWDAGLGNGGLGRLAACFQDSMATLGLAAMGYGIRYDYGIFKQLLIDGGQMEFPDNWLRYGNPWEISRPERLYPVHFYGHVNQWVDKKGRHLHDWVDTEDVMAMAHDVLVPGYHNDVVNTLRLWSAKASREFNFSYFNRGDYIEAVHEKDATENISRVLYPNDTVVMGKELRLKQEYFFVSATLQDALHRHLKAHPDLTNLADKAVFQLNDTHPTIAVAEMMRLLLDKQRLAWEEAWQITRNCFAYTNHTILPEALEVWPVWLMERVLPRHMEIIFEINRRFLNEVRARFPGDEARVQRVSMIQEGNEQQVRMANLAIVGSFSVNGVSALHSRILQERIFPDFAQIYPGKFNNKTNGITPRRWLLKSNRGLAGLITSRIGEEWICDLRQLERLVPLADDPEFQQQWREVKLENKRALATYIARHCRVQVDPASLFDVQVKRIHEYKRQLLNVLHIVSLYLEYRTRPPSDGVPRTFIFAGKAAPGYFMAKLVIRLILAVANMVNRNPAVSPFLKVAFLPNYSVSLAERLMPAADLSEQISTAGTEASGTGNMKLSLNGALTLGTLDGANIEIMDAVGKENFFTFGLSYEEAQEMLRQGYNPMEVYEADPVLKAAVDSIAQGEFSPGDAALFQPIVESLLHRGDFYMVLADFASYRAMQQQVAALYADPAQWTRKSILNVARMGRFSSDITISEYAQEIWGVQPTNGH